MSLPRLVPMTMEKQPQAFPVAPRRVQTIVFLRIGFIFAVLLVAVPASPQHDPAGHYAAPAAGQPLCNVEIHTTGFRNNAGTAGTLVFSSSNGWPDKKSRAVVWGGFPIAAHEATQEFQLPPGRYAVVVIHDENSNMKLDRNFMGVPKEGFGFSNNPRVVFSAPSFQAASAQVSCPVTQIHIAIIYK